MSIRIEVLSDQEDKLLERRIISFKVIHDKAGTPKRTDIKAKLAEALKADPEMIFLRPLQQKFGGNEANGTATVYRSAERGRLVERQYLTDRLKPKEKKEEQKEEKKPEEKKPEKKTEKKEEKPEKREEKKVEKKGEK